MDYQRIANSWETYDYEDAVFNDAKEAILEYIDYHKDEGDLPDDIEDMRDDLNDVLWTEDSVTGNVSGSYTFSRIMAELYLIGNSDLYEDALEDFGGEFNPEPENRDVTIRCHLLGGAIDKALEDEDVKKAFEAAKQE